MQTRIPLERLQDPRVREADGILRTCVHCGFCTATCPTYQLLGDELDGPRGRIYLIKSFLEGEETTERTRLHLDRCLTCRACETTCPSGVRYGRLADIGREMVEDRTRRSPREALTRALLRRVVPYPGRFAPFLRLGQALSPLLPGPLRRKVPRRQTAPPRPATEHPRRMLVLEGCAQSVATPATNGAAARVLDRLGVQLVGAPGAGCCGAVDQHLAAPEAARAHMRRNIDAWWPHIEAGAEAIVVSATGCATVVKDYGHLLADDPAYAGKAARVSALARDLAEVVRDEPLPADLRPPAGPVAFHSPCTLQHGQQLPGVVEGILARAGFELTAVADAHLCCGSAGTYSILQPELSGRLLEGKVRALEAGAPAVIATANVGCQLHLGSAAGVPVRHWVELLDEALGAG